MMRLHRNPLLCSCLLLAALDLGTRPAEAETVTVPLPAWQVLEFEQRALWVTAHSEVAIAPAPGDARQWQLTASSSVAKNSEEVILTLAACDGRLLERSRLSRGRDQRYKSYEFLADLVLRERRTPGANADTPPSGWPLRSRKKISYPPLSPATVITDAYALLVLAERFQASTESAAELVVITDFNFYRVRMSHGQGRVIEVNYQLTGLDRAVTGTRDTSAVRLQITTVGTPRDKPDFALLGLQDEITLLFDRATGLPLQIHGIAPRVGRTQINLKSVTLRAQDPKIAPSGGLDA